MTKEWCLTPGDPVSVPEERGEDRLDAASKSYARAI